MPVYFGLLNMLCHIEHFHILPTKQHRNCEVFVHMAKNGSSPRDPETRN
jgi:hypothetical protein